MYKAGFVIATIALVLVGVSSLACAEDGFELKVIDKEPPAELDDNLRGQLTPKAHQLSDGDGLFFEFWFASSIPLKAPAETSKDMLKNIEEITLLGAVVVHQEERYDFRDDPIDPGLFVMRLALQPQDGNHMGTAPFNTFALLLPHEKDAEVLEYPDHETLVELASEDTVAEHPPILSAQPLDDASGEFPRLAEGGDDWHFLCLKLPAKAGEKNMDLVFQLVFEGVGEL